MEAYRSAVSPLWKQGFVNGTMLGSFILLYAILTLYGSHLLYKDIRKCLRVLFFSSLSLGRYIYIYIY